MKPRVFVSSVVDGFNEFRQAAREGIIEVGGEPLLVNEDFPSMITSSRNACLDAVDSSDYLVTVIGARGGWTTPSGRLVVEEEYDRARSKKIPVLVFLQNVERDLIAKALEEARNNRSRAARLLGITRSQLYYRMQKHGLDLPAGQAAS